MKVSPINTREYETKMPDYIGGGVWLPENIEWPTNPLGEKLVHVLTISAKSVTPYMQNFMGSEKEVISIFSSYSDEEYYLDSICYNGDKTELDDILSGYTQVIVYTPTLKKRQESDFSFHTVGISIGDPENEDGDPEQFSKIGGNPALLQNEKLNLDHFEFCLQLSPSMLSNKYDDIFYLADAIGYLYLSTNTLLTENRSGIFFIQVT